MRIENKTNYYFEEKDKRVFLYLLKVNGLTMSDFAKKCFISSSMLTLIINGKRSLPNDFIKEFDKLTTKEKMEYEK